MSEREAGDDKPVKPFTGALLDFMSMAREAAQMRILQFFIKEIIESSDICEQGSVMCYRPPASSSANDDGTLWLAEKGVNVNSMSRFPEDIPEFNLDETFGGLTFRKKAPEYAPNAVRHPQFKLVKDQDIGAIYCVPILVAGRDKPFGVVSFHNSSHSAEFNPDRRTAMELAVRSLEAMLALSRTPLVPDERVFIVHGRDERFREQLEDILKEVGIDYIVLQSLARTGHDLLAFIENKAAECVAGFVLLTPDDEGRLYEFGVPMRQRARQNVIFEGGYLTALFRRQNRICFLQKGDLEMPTDLSGLLMEKFDDRIDPGRIKLALAEWGLQPRQKRVGRRKTSGGVSLAARSSSQPSSEGRRFRNKGGAHLATVS
jgi:predicted nucleotide-binding protein